MVNLRQELKRGKHVLGSWISSVSPAIAELMASCGFDFLCLDVEHSALDLGSVQHILQAIQAGNPQCFPVVRAHGVDYAFLKRYVDAGARGIVAPLVNSAEQAQAVIDSVKYPPMGKRGVGFCRANLYGGRVIPEFERANEETFVAVQIEHIDAVGNIDAILSVKGIDAAFIGPYDLTASMRIPGKFGHKEYLNVLKRILVSCKDNGVVPGIHIVQPDEEEIRRRIREGFQLLAYSLDVTMVMSCSVSAVRSFQRMKKEIGR